MSSVTSFEPTKALSTARPKQRSRSGCLTCRSRGYKCDEKKPICRACSRLGRSCQYGAAKKWINESVINNNRVVIKQAYGPATEGVRNRVRRVEGPKESGNGEVQVLFPYAAAFSALLILMARTGLWATLRMTPSENLPAVYHTDRGRPFHHPCYRIRFPLWTSGS